MTFRIRSPNSVRRILPLHARPFRWCWSVSRIESLRWCICDDALDGRQSVLDELRASHLALDISHVQIGVEQQERIAHGVNNILELEAMLRIAFAPPRGKSIEDTINLL